MLFVAQMENFNVLHLSPFNIIEISIKTNATGEKRPKKKKFEMFKFMTIKQPH